MFTIAAILISGLWVKFAIDRQTEAMRDYLDEDEDEV